MQSHGIQDVSVFQFEDNLMTFKPATETDGWSHALRAAGGIIRLVIAAICLLVSGFMLWWLIVLVVAAARFVTEHWG